MASLNRVSIIGNLGVDPELQYSAIGHAVGRLVVATCDLVPPIGDNTAHEKRIEWHTVIIHGRLAEVATEVLGKGSRVYLEGRLQTRSWLGSDGGSRYRTEIICSHLQNLDGRGVEVPE